MKTLLRVALVALCGCGGGPSAVCGAGTELRNGECVVSQDMTPGTNPLTDLLDRPNVAFSRAAHIKDVGSNDFYFRRVVLTHLAYQAAEAWTNDGTPLIGKGTALMIAGAQPIPSYEPLGSPLADLTIDSCSTSADLPTYLVDNAGNPRDGKAYGALYDWDTGHATKGACITAGVVHVDSTGATTITAQFDDGTVWSDEQFRLGSASQ